MCSGADGTLGRLAEDHPSRCCTVILRWLAKPSRRGTVAVAKNIENNPMQSSGHRNRGFRPKT
jgi:hypothetical protein